MRALLNFLQPSSSLFRPLRCLSIPFWSYPSEWFKVVLCEIYIFWAWKLHSSLMSCFCLVLSAWILVEENLGCSYSPLSSIGKVKENTTQYWQVHSMHRWARQLSSLVSKPPPSPPSPPPTSWPPGCPLPPARDQNQPKSTKIWYWCLKLSKCEGWKYLPP